MASRGPTRLSCIALICFAAACSDHAPTTVAETPAQQPAQAQNTFASPYTSTPSLEEAVAFPAISTETTDSWRLLQASQREAADHIAIVEMERPVSHHPYIYERRRSGDWIADVWRNGDGTHESLSYFNVRTGVRVDTIADDAGDITTVIVAQADDFTDERREPMGEHATHLGERCAIWRTVPRSGPGARFLKESCLTEDGIELWARDIGQNLPNQPDYERPRMHVSSIRRGPIDPSLARPRREWFDWTYWRARAAAAAADMPSADAPPDHSIWYEEHRTAARGRVIAARYRNNWRAELSHEWYDRGDRYEYSLVGPGLTLHARAYAGDMVLRSVRIDVQTAPRRWRPAPSTVTRGESQTILGRTCHWIAPRNPPHDASWRACWTDDNLVLAREHHGRAGRGGEAAVRLDMTAPSAPLQPPAPIFTWIRQVAS